MEALMTVFSKVLVMLLLGFIGYILSKKSLLSKQGASDITAILLRVVTPCVIINSFTSSAGSISPAEMGMATGIAVLTFAISIAISLVAYRKEPPKRKPVLQFAETFGNIGFMGIPLVQGIVGDVGVVYASFGIVIFNIVVWTFGYRLMNSSAKLSLRTIFLNPGMIGLAIGLPLYFLGISLPSFISETVSFVSGLNTPLAMIIVGSYVAGVDIKSFMSDSGVYKTAVLRLIVAPGLLFLILLLLKPPQALFETGVIQASMPVAANTVMFASTYDKDSLLASKCVAVTTVFSLITIPIFAMLAQAFAP